MVTRSVAIQLSRATPEGSPSHVDGIFQMQSFKTLRAQIGVATLAALLLPASDALPKDLPANVTLEDIVEARSIDSLSISPDGEYLTYRLIMPSVSRNTTQVQWYRVGLDQSGPPEPLGRPFEATFLPNFDVVEDGVSQIAPDSRSLYVLGLAKSEVQVHRIGRDEQDELVTNDAADVVSFTVSADDRQLTYSTRAPRSDIAAGQQAEESIGVHLDRTVNTDGLRLTRNFKIGDRATTIRKDAGGIPLEAFSGVLRSKSVQLAGGTGAPLRRPSGWQNGASKLIVTTSPGATNTALPLAGGRSVRLVETSAADAVLHLPRYRVQVTGRNGVDKPCPQPFCSGLSLALRLVTTLPQTGEIVIQFERDFSGRSIIYGWNPNSNRARVIYDAEGSLDGGSGYNPSSCLSARTRLICVRSGPNRPHELLAIDLVRGRATVLADPNAELAAKRFPIARFLSWTDSHGRAANGVLVLPDAKADHLPLAITTYRCRGFLRGASGWMASEHILAERGFAVLCVNNNNEIQREADPAIPLVAHKASIEAYDAAIDLLAKDDLIDRSRVGIVGHSYSSNVVTYAISHTDLFAAAIAVGSTIDPSAYFITAPTPDSWRKYVPKVMGLPPPTHDPMGIYRQVSPALNACRINAPLLLQAAESEYLFGLQLYTYIADAGGTVDMYIYPAEGHLGNRLPSHILSRNRRSIDWLSFWLGPSDQHMSINPMEIEHWRSLRESRRSPSNDCVAKSADPRP